MDKAQEIDILFRQLNDSLVKEYEDNLHDWKQQEERRRKKLALDEKEIRAILSDSGVNIERLEARERKDADDLTEYLKDVRPKLIERPTRLAVDFKERSIYSAISSRESYVEVSPYAASLLVPDKSLLGNVKGETGNPWILPYNPEDINIVAPSIGSGWGCWAEGMPPPVVYNVWFHFVPEETGSWLLWAIFAFHGFYILRANDSWYNCKSARVHAQASMNVHQYFWRGWKDFQLINREEDNIEMYSLYDSSRLFENATNLRARDDVWVLVQISISAYARGDGSYAEINFSDGLANYIKPYALIAFT